MGNVLGTLFGDIAKEIRAKTGETGTMKPAEFPEKISEISVGSDPVVQALEVTENGTYTPPEGVDGYAPVAVNVPAPEIVLQNKTITENGTYTADSGFDGLGEVTVEFADVRYVTFMSEDGTVELGEKAVATGDDCADPIARGVFSTPTKESTAQYSYTFAGWAMTPNGGLDSNALKAVNENRTVYVNFISTVRYCTVRFYDGKTLLHTESVPYGSSSDYKYDKVGYDFAGWKPEPTNVTADMDCYAQFIVKAIVSRKLVDRTLSGEYTNDRVTSVGDYAFYDYPPLTTVDFPSVTSIGNYAFSKCTKLTTVNFTAVTSIGGYTFELCSRLATLILRNTEKVATLSNTSVFKDTPIKSGTGYIYVPAALVDSYKAATNWSTYAAQFRAIEDYPEICGGEN